MIDRDGQIQLAIANLNMIIRLAGQLERGRSGDLPEQASEIGGAAEQAKAALQRALGQGPGQPLRGS